MSLQLDNVSFRYKDDAPYIFSGLSLEFPVGKTIAIMGPSGIGKTTLSRIIVGLSQPTLGQVLINGKRLIEPSSKITITFQDNPCFPWLNVLENVKFGIQNQPNANQRATNLVKDIGLNDSLTEFPKALSGGMKQRVNIARSLAISPQYLVLDEPFSALDVMTKQRIFALLRKEQQINKTGYIIILHSIEDAYDLADIIYVFGKRPSQIILKLEEVRREPFVKFKTALLKAISQSLIQ